MPIFARVLLIVGAGVLGLAAVVVIVVLAVPHPAADDTDYDSPAARFVTAAPVTAAATPVGSGVQGLASPAWVASAAKATGIPSRALAAYAGTAIQIRSADPACGIGWNTLAGIGEVESRHGTIFGGKIDAGGTVSPPIFGVALDGVSSASIPDSDGGAIDGDATVDRAVGPMQLIPASWRNWHTDASGDGKEDPQNIDDATMAAAHYLCRAGTKLSTESGWRAAVLAYNNSDQYLADVIRYGTAYAKDVAGAK